MLPEVDDWDDASMWLPANFLDFDLSREGWEYKFVWIEGIVWPHGSEPDEREFYRSSDHWVRVSRVVILDENRVR